MAQDRCQALLAAGLPAEARAGLADLLAREGIDPVHRANCCSSSPSPSSAAGTPAPRWLPPGVLAIVSGGRGGSCPPPGPSWPPCPPDEGWAIAGPRWRGAAAELARQLEDLALRGRALAWLVAGRAAADLGGGRDAALGAAARYRRHPSGLVRATAWLAQALDGQGHGDVRGVWRACRHGLDALDDHRRTLGSTELRALASLQGDELARLAHSHAAGSRPRTQLWWSERWRATALAARRPGRPRDRSWPGCSLRCGRTNAGGRGARRGRTAG